MGKNIVMLRVGMEYCGYLGHMLGFLVILGHWKPSKQVISMYIYKKIGLN